MKQKIEGVIVYDMSQKIFVHREYFNEECLNSGDFQGYVFVCNHTIEIELPDDLDLVTPQLESLAAQEKDLTIKFNQALQHIKVARNNLLAIEGN